VMGLAIIGLKTTVRFVVQWVTARQF
jgi:hypothetical protein